MKIKVLIVTVIFSFLILGVAWFVNGMFPYAPPIFVPPAESIIALYVSSNESGKAVVLREDLEKIIHAIDHAKPTRKMSTNDYPTARPYYIIEVLSGGNTTRYFVYEEYDSVYLENPYQGVYAVNRNLLETVNSYFGG